MSVICQTFVQNTWRKDLCSNCFKSKEEHETERKSSVGGGSGIRETEGGNFSSIGLNRGLDGGVGGGSKRYLGVAGSVYQRSYYNRNSWNSMILDKTDSGLKSPGLIKGMSHLINQENEKNLKLSDMMDSEDSLRSSRLVQCVKASQSEAKLLTELLGDSVDDRQLQHEIKKEPDKPLKYFASRTNASPETSDNINSNAGSSSSSYETIFKTAQSNTTPSSNYNGVSDHIERDKEVMELTCDQVNDKEKDSSKTISFSILKHAGDSKSSKGSISFCSKLEEIIGYGGDVDYSDNEDTLNDDDDDDDDDDYDDFMDLTPDERVLRRLTEKNTEFNADNDNLKKDIEELLPSVKELEEKRKMIIAEIEELERLGKERSKDEKSKHPDEKKEEKPEGKVKLKRSPPLVSVKPLIARNKNEVRVNQVWPMKNGEIIRSGVSSDIEEVPLKGIKPKYVSREEEMIEKISCENETKTCATKITSVDEICISEYSKEEKVTSIDAICNSQNAKPERLTPIDYVCDLYANGTVKSDEICLIESSAITRMENLIQEQEPLKLSQEKNPEPLECKSVMLDMKREAEAFTITSERTDTYTSKNAESPHHGSQEAKLSITSSVSVGNSLHHVGKKDLDKKVPVSAPRKSLLSTLESSNKVLSALDPSDDAIAKVCHDCEIQKDTSDISNDSVLLSLKKSSVDRNYEQDHNDIFRDSEMVAINSIIDSESQVKEDTSLRNARDVTQKLNKSSFSSSDAVLSRQVPVNNEALEVPSSKDSLRLSYSFPNAKAFVAQSELESPRISEISKMSNGNSSNLFTTFGTPVTTSSSQNSFLYSPSSRSVYNDSNLQSPLYTPATTDFLKEIKSHPEVPKPTASIQKSALYASTSCLKGLPGGKPVITPKPPILKEKPKVPFKPAPSSSRIYSTPSQIISKPVVANIPFRASTPKPVGEDNIESKHNLVPNTSSFNAEGPFDSLCKVPQDKKKPPPTIHAPAIPAPSGAQKDEVLYDIPVTIASTQFISNVNNSSSCPTEATIYQEIDDQLGQNMLSEESSDSMMVTSNTSESLVSSKIGNVASPVIRSESSRCDSRSTFEANRSLVSAALELGSNSLKRCDGKRIAPQPPMEECISLLVEDVNNTITCGTSMNGDLQSQEGYSACMDNNDGESYSSFTDDFDDDEEEPEQRRIVSRKAERSSSAIPYYRNSIGNILTYEIQNLSTTDPKGHDIPHGLECVTENDLHYKPVASRSHSVPRTAEIMIISDPTPTSFTTFSSKFSFGRSGFFRPPSPPEVKQEGQNERGRDRTKKSISRFSLKKLLRLGSKEDEKKQKEHDKRLLRETKRGKLQIIHPLDYNQNGVEVIARPEKTSPIYDYSGIYGYIPPPKLTSKLGNVYDSSSSVPQETNLVWCESGASHNCTEKVSASNHLGYNSEGRPKPPPPPRKGSLESSQYSDIYSSPSEADDITISKLHVSDSPTPMEASSRPHRPPPPTRTPSNAGCKSGPPRPDPPKFGRDSVYANIGDVRAPITPRKPGRSASIRGDEDREKRRAPQPPSAIQGLPDLALQAVPKTSRHQQQDSIGSNCSSLSTANRSSKGPAPPRPQNTSQNHDNESYECDSSYDENYISNQILSASPVHYDAPLAYVARSDIYEDLHTPDGYICPPQLPSLARITQIVVGSTSSSVVMQSGLNHLYQVPTNNSQITSMASAPSLHQEKMGRLSVRRTSAVTHRSLEDQYGAVISANLEALSNMLDQLSSNSCPSGYEDVNRQVKQWKDVSVAEDIFIGAGQRLFYAGVACGKEITLMITPETKVDAHHLLMHMPIVTFRDQIPSHLLSHTTIVTGKTSPGTVCILPSLSLTTLKSIAEENYPQLLKSPFKWERHTCLVLLQYVTGLKHLQAQGVEDTSCHLTLVARGSEAAGQDPDPRIILVPPMDTCIPVMSLCECAATAMLMLIGVDPSFLQANVDHISIPSEVPSKHAFSCLLELLRLEKSGSLTKVMCILEVLLFGPDTSMDGESLEEMEASLQKWLDLERATVLQTLIREPVQSSVITKFHLNFLVRSNPKILRETMRLLPGILC